MPYIYGRNPVIEALTSGKQIQKVYVQHELQGEKIQHIFRLARDREIPISTAPLKRLQQMVGKGVHQGVVALISTIDVHPVETLLDRMIGMEDPGTIVVLDRMRDPHNMGAIIRSAEIFGAKALVFSTTDSVPLTDTVVKASAGAALHLPLYSTSNLTTLIDQLQEIDTWVYGADLDGTTPLWDLDFQRKSAIIIGSEEKGIRSTLLKKCDVRYRIPQSGMTPSLNASVAAGVTLAEYARQNAQKN